MCEGAADGMRFRSETSGTAEGDLQRDYRIRAVSRTTLANPPPGMPAGLNGMPVTVDVRARWLSDC